MPSFSIFGFDLCIYVFWLYSRVADAVTHAMPRYAVGQLMRKRKETRENIINSNRGLVALQNEARGVEQEVSGVNKVLCALRERKRRLDRKVALYYIDLLYIDLLYFTGTRNLVHIMNFREVC